MAELTETRLYDTMKGNMTEINVGTRKGRAEARDKGVSYDVEVRGIRYIYSPEQAERLAAQIPDEAELV